MDERCHKHSCKALCWQQSRSRAWSCAGQWLQVHSTPSAPWYLFDLDETCFLSGMRGQGVLISPALKKCYIKVVEPRH